MAPPKPKPASDDAKPAVSVAKITKTRATKGTNANINVNTAAPSTATSATSRVERYKNGLLNLKKAPPPLVHIALRSATQSPLLRLPAEIRIQIWKLAMCSFPLVFLPDSDNHRGFAGNLELKTGSRVRDFREPRRSDLAYKVNKLPAAFHLSEVCRQVYAETALAPYSHNTFYVLEQYLLRKGAVVQRLTVAQRQAIVSVQIDPGFLAHYVGLTLTRTNVRVPLTSVLPNLKVMLVPAVAMEYFIYQEESILGIVSRLADAVRCTRVAERLRYLHGDGITVKFEDANTGQFRELPVTMGFS